MEEKKKRIGKKCIHEKRKYDCKICTNPIKIMITRMISGARTTDKRHDRFDAINFIDKVFMQELIATTGKTCFYCKKDLQYVLYNDSLATIERFDNSYGHIKNNCVIACLDCNRRHRN